MSNKINLQYLISYLGISPFIIILFDKFLLHLLNHNIMKDFIVFYALIIFVFIGAMNWNLKENISKKLIFFGFMPSLISVFIILLFLYSYPVFLILIFFFMFQLILDIFIYSKIDRKIYYSLRMPLTFIIVISLFLIQL